MWSNQLHNHRKLKQVAQNHVQINISKERDSVTFLDNMCQCFFTHTVKCFLTLRASCISVYAYCLLFWHYASPKRAWLCPCCTLPSNTCICTLIIFLPSLFLLRLSRLSSLSPSSQERCCCPCHHLHGPELESYLY